MSLTGILVFLTCSILPGEKRIIKISSNIAACFSGKSDEHHAKDGRNSASDQKVFGLRTVVALAGGGIIFRRSVITVAFAVLMLKARSGQLRVFALYRPAHG